MKKMTLVFVTMGILVSSAFGAFATDYYPMDDGKGNLSYTVDYTVTADQGHEEEIEAGKSMYGLIAVKGTGEIDLESESIEIVYIDQAKIQNGKITFSGFLPLGEEPDSDSFEECTLFVGGPGFAGAKQIGVLKEKPDGVIISGTVTDTVTSSSSTKKATITAKSGDATVGAPVQVGENGAYSITVPIGTTYSIVITKDGFLPYTITGVPATAPLSGVDADISGCAGDVDGNKVIELDDLRAVLADYNESENLENANADVDSNAIVELDDLRAVLANYNETQASKTQAYTAE